MTERAVTFHDSYWYCYANSTAMLLASVGETISPRLIEALSGVGLGAFQNRQDLPFFSGLTGKPDAGISAALDLLGFAFSESASEESTPAPFERLQALLKDSAVVIGPLDMSHLTYNPMRPRQSGIDHFVLVFGVEGERFRLHDPAGFANVLIEHDDLQAAWQAESIAYRNGHYRRWSHAWRKRQVSDDALYDATLEFFRNQYLAASVLADEQNETIDGALIRHWAKTASHGEFTDSVIGHLTHFALPLGAKRALDYATFFNAHHAALADLKHQQAVAFGACHSAMMKKSWREAGDRLLRIADLEEAIAQAIRIA
ncbi:MAG: hypothetical protein ABI439_02345 [Rhodospirillales bacterium]